MRVEFSQRGFEANKSFGEGEDDGEGRVIRSIDRQSAETCTSPRIFSRE